jgi:DMSO/TMAO reductase YedYZ molybdopterin-dependent catalytic subunit
VIATVERQQQTPAQVEQVDLLAPPGELLTALGKDPRLVPYGAGNFGMPLALMEPDGDAIAPTERFFMRSNGPVPVVDPATWTLAISGAVDRPLTLRLADLRAMPRRSFAAFLECAGNGRTRFDPVPEGTPWGNDAAGNALWEGVPLRDVLALAGLRDEAVDVVAQGADFPAMRRGLPRAVACDPDTLLVLKMNGEPLTVAHGGPVRLLVPGWAGIASTKWLVGLEALDHAFAGFWNADNYVYWSEDGAALRPVTEMPVKSVIGTPLPGAVLAPGEIDIAGYAWSGHGAVARVDVSVDGGATWRPAALAGTGRRGWARFHFRWHAAPGSYRLMARATDERGLSQPREAAWNGKGYAQNGIHAVAATVRDDPAPQAPGLGKEG